MLIRIYPSQPNRKEIGKAVKILQEGGVIICPTDTLYAIGCDALNARAVEAICRIKGLNPEKKNNLSIACDNLSTASRYARIDNAAFKLMKKNLPGPFTFLLPTGNELPKVYRNKKEIGIRIPNNPIINALVSELGNPIMTSSVHSDDAIEYLTDPELIHEKYVHLGDLVIDGGMGDAEPSTIVNCITEPFDVIRQGKGQLLQP